MDDESLQQLGVVTCLFAFLALGWACGYWWVRVDVTRGSKLLYNHVVYKCDARVVK